jgi:predicted transcriptional regulator
MVGVRMEHMLRILGTHSKYAAEDALAPLGMRPMEYDVMEIISRYMDDPDVPNLTMTIIAKRMGVLVPTVYNYIGNLQRSGYVREATGRSRLLTGKGETMLDDCRRALRDSERNFADLFPPEVLEGITKAFLTHEEREGALHHT